MRKPPYLLFAFILFIQLFDFLSLNVWEWFLKLVPFPVFFYDYAYHIYDTMVSMAWLLVYALFWWLGRFLEKNNERAVYMTITIGMFWFAVNDLIQEFLNEQSNYDFWEWACFYLFLFTTALTIIKIYRKTLFVKQ